MAVRFGIDYSHLMSTNIGTEHGLTEAELLALEPQLARVHQEIAADLSAGADQASFGFWHLPDQPQTLLDQMLRRAAETKPLADSHVVLGIGGSYLGAKMIFEALCHRFHNELPANRRGRWPRIYFEGNGLDAPALSDLLDRLEGEDVTIQVVSKSGGTIETLAAMEVLRQQCGDRIKAWTLTTDPAIDPQTGAEKPSEVEKYFRSLRLSNPEVLRHPPNVGGRYSVLSPVGLFPAAMMGLGIEQILHGAAQMRQRCRSRHVLENPAYLSAALQYLSLLKGRDTSVMAVWDKRLEAFGLWYDQLSAESLGKDGRGRTPLTAVCTRELHSRGQQHQQGTRDKVITNIVVQDDQSAGPLCVPEADPEHVSGGEYAAGRAIADVNHAAYRATDTAYAKDQRPGMTLSIGRIDEEHLGAMVFFFELATIVEGKLMGVNPIDQPGVQAYKDFLGGLLGRPGYEQFTEEAERWTNGRRSYVL